MSKFIFILLLTIASCGSQEKPQENNSENTNVQSDEISLALGASTQAGNEKVTFVRVIEDSRCPEGTQCVWAGAVKVEVHFSEDEMTFDTKTVTLENNQPALLFENRTHLFTVKAVSPYPKEGDLGKRDYMLVLELKKK